MLKAVKACQCQLNIFISLGLLVSADSGLITTRFITLFIFSAALSS